MIKKPFEEIKDTLKTGDIVLFSGQYKMSKVVEELEESKWSHVAMVMRLPEYDFPLLYEATALTNLPNLLDGSHKTGPKIVNMLERLETYGDDLKPYKPPLYAVRRLEKPLPDTAIPILKDILKELSGLPNPNDWNMIFGTLLGRYLHIKTPMTSITCSGFMALTYESLGLLKSKRPINGFVPKDFSTDGKLDLIDNHLGEEIVMELPLKEEKKYA